MVKKDVCQAGVYTLLRWNKYLYICVYMRVFMCACTSRTGWFLFLLLRESFFHRPLLSLSPACPRLAARDAEGCSVRWSSGHAGFPGEMTWEAMRFLGSEWCRIFKMLFSMGFLWFWVCSNLVLGVDIFDLLGFFSSLTYMVKYKDNYQQGFAM